MTEVFLPRSNSYVLKDIPRLNTEHMLYCISEKDRKEKEKLTNKEKQKAKPTYSINKEY